MRRIAFAFVALSVVLNSLSVTGCGPPPTGQVRGKVIVNDSPLVDGFVSFTAVDGETKTAGAAVKDGAYLAADVPPGPKIVSVRPAAPAQALPGSGAAAKLKFAPAIPPDAQGNHVRHTVTVGEQSLDLQIRY